MLNVGLLDGLLGGAGMIITSDGWDHSRKFPAFSTSKKMIGDEGIRCKLCKLCDS